MYSAGFNGFGRKTESNRPGLVSSITRKAEAFFKKSAVVAEPGNVEKTTATGYSAVDSNVNVSKIQKLGSTRKGIYTDLDEMDSNDEIASRALSIIADCTVGYEETDTDAFKWKVGSKDKKVQEILDDLKIRLNLGNQAWHIVRNAVKFGDEYREVVIDNNGIIQRFVHLPAFTVWPNRDERNIRIPGWEQRIDNVKPGEGIQFKEWQIISFSCGPKNGEFGTGLMTSARRTWRRLQKIEDGMVTARISRAYDKLKHKVPVKESWDESKRRRAIEEYKTIITKKKVIGSDGSIYESKNPISVETDFFIPDDGTGKGDIDTIEPKNAQLQNLNDVEYFRDKMVTCSTVPKHYLNLGANTTKGALSSGGTSLEDIQFARTLRQAQSTLRKGLLELAALALYLQGYFIDEHDVNVDLPKISTEDFLHTSLTRLNMAKAAQVFSQILGGMPVDLMASKFMMLDDEEKEILREFVKNPNAPGSIKTFAAGNFSRTFDDRITSPNGTAPPKNAKMQDLVNLLTNILVQGDEGEDRREYIEARVTDALLSALDRSTV